MASIFNGLNIGYTGLTASQLGINTTGQNISNAETDGYTRQRVVQQSTTPLGNVQPGAQGNGTQVVEIVRIHDEFVFSSYRTESERKEYSSFERQTLEELSTYFPEIENVGIKYDMQEYFNLWGDLSVNPDNQSVKIALAQQSEVLSAGITNTRTQISDLQVTLNEQLKASVDEVNRLGQEIANLNQGISEIEATKGQHANDLRDKRGVLEISLSELVGAQVFKGSFSSNQSVDRSIVENGDDYTMNVAGFNIIDGKNFHPIHIENKNNPAGFYSLSYERQDGKLLPMDDSIKGGRIGSILDLRGSAFDENGKLENGQLQEIIDELDSFSLGLIESTNNLYAQAAQESMTSDSLDIAGTDSLVSSTLNIHEGLFDIVAYDIDGNEVSRRSIDINAVTSMDDGVYDINGNVVKEATLNSVVGQLRASKDDNEDGNPDNDINSILNINFKNNNLQINVNGSEFPAYTFAIEDNQADGLASGTNFAGSLGLSKFFEGTDATDINLNTTLSADPSKIKASKAPIDGNNELANDMLQLQFEDVSFTVGSVTRTDSLYAYFDSIATDVGIKTNAAIVTDDTVTAKYNAVVLQYESVSKVNVDEELVSLIKYQTAYGAAAKIITTIDQMMDTLLGLKQ